MSAQAEMLERAWSRLAGAGEAGNRASLEGALREPTARPVAAELRMAAGLRGAMTALPTPDVDVEWARLVHQLEAPTPAVVEAKARRPKRWARIAVTAAVAGGTLAGLSMRAAGAAPGSLLYPFRKVIEKAVLLVSPGDARVHLEIARARLDDLVGALDHREFRLTPGLGRDLVDARRAAVRSGADVTALDREIAARVPKALANAPAPTANAVRGILGSLLPPPSAIPLPGAPPQTEGSPSTGEHSTGPSQPGSSDDQGGSGSDSDLGAEGAGSGDQQDEQSTRAGDQNDSESDADAGGGATSSGDDESSGGGSGANDSQGNDSDGGDNGQGGGGDSPGSSKG
jgi:hypothetical protein